MATITRFASTTERRASIVILPLPCLILFTGDRRSRRLRPSSSAIRSQISPVPPTKRNIWAPSRVLKLRSKVPTFSSFPEAAM